MTINLASLKAAVVVRVDPVRRCRTTQLSVRFEPDRSVSFPLTPLRAGAAVTDEDVEHFASRIGAVLTENAANVAAGCRPVTDHAFGRQTMLARHDHLAA